MSIRIMTIKLHPPVPFIDIEKAISRSVNRMLSVRHGSKILKMFSTTKWEELLKVECLEWRNRAIFWWGQSRVGPQDEKSSNLHITADSTGSIHKNARGKKFDPKKVRLGWGKLS